MRALRASWFTSRADSALRLVLRLLGDPMLTLVVEASSLLLEVVASFVERVLFVVSLFALAIQLGPLAGVLTLLTFDFRATSVQFLHRSILVTNQSYFTGTASHWMIFDVKEPDAGLPCQSVTDRG